MATALGNINKCPVCLEAYEHPKIQPCDHSLCANCVEGVRRGSRIKCPVCNTTHDVAKLRADVRLEQFIDALKEGQPQRQRSEKPDGSKKCEICYNLSSSFYCEECDQWMCRDCKTLHLRTKATKHHKVLPTALKCKQVTDTFSAQSSNIKQQDLCIDKTRARIGGLQIDPTDARQARDSVKQSALADTPVNLVTFSEKKFTQIKKVDLKTYPVALRMFGDELWSCQESGTIEIFNLELQKTRTIVNRACRAVHGVTDLPGGDLVIAGYGGLCHTTSNGETLNEIDTSRFTSVEFYDNKLYAYAGEPARVLIYQLRDTTWNKLDTLNLPFRKNANVTLIVTDNAITACSENDDKIIVMSLAGKVRRTFGEYGSGAAGKVKYPKLCQSDRHGSLLIDDMNNHRLQVVDKHGQWRVVDMQPAVEFPQDAVYTHNKLYVVAYNDVELSLYTSD